MVMIVLSLGRRANAARNRSSSIGPRAECGSSSKIRSKTPLVHDAGHDQSLSLTPRQPRRVVLALRPYCNFPEFRGPSHAVVPVLVD